MKQKYPDGEVYAPGTVVISAAAHCDDITGVVEPVLKKSGGDIYYINLSQDAYKLGGSSLAQILNKIGDRAPSVNDATRLANAVNKLQELIHAGQITAGHDISSGGLITCLLELCFSDNQLGAAIDLTELQESDLARLLFSENAGLIIQSSSDMTKAFGEVNVHCIKIGQPTEDGLITVTNYARKEIFDVAKLRDSWFETSYLLDDRQTQNGLAQARYNNYKAQALDFVFPEKWTATIADLNNSEPRPKAAIIREKGSNSERELAHAMYLAGFDVKDVHMTDLISGREDLTEIQFIGAVGGFSNSDVLGSAKGWAGAFLYNPKAKKALEAFFEREDVLSVGICNGCQLFLELDLINPEHEGKDKMTYNKSGKHESNFTSVEIIENNSVMLNTLAGTKLGVWISHGEGRFSLPMPESDYGIVAKYGYKDYPANPNGSDYNTAMLCSPDGRHLATMPHIERSIFKWNWAHYPDDQNELVSPWIAAFVNARNWINNKNKG